MLNTLPTRLRNVVFWALGFVCCGISAPSNESWQLVASYDRAEGFSAASIFIIEILIYRILFVLIC